MRKAAILLAAVAALYFLPSIVLEAVYGPSYNFPPSEDCWMPDGSAGWIRHGSPTGPPPSSPSVDVPIVLQYLPIFLPAVLLALFMFGPLSKRMEDELPSEQGAETEETETETGTDKHDV